MHYDRSRKIGTNCFHLFSCYFAGTPSIVKSMYSSCYFLRMRYNIVLGYVVEIYDVVMTT